MMYRPHRHPKPPQPATQAVLAAFWAVFAMLGLFLPSGARAELADARVVFVHAAPVGPAAAGAAFRVDDGAAVVLAPHARSVELAVTPGHRTVAVDVSGDTPLVVEHAFVADQTYVVLLAGDGSRQPYTVVVDLPATVVPRRGLALVTVRDTATLPGLLPGAATAIRYDHFLDCDGTLQRSAASFGAVTDFAYSQVGVAPARCRAGLIERDGVAVAAEVAFDGRSGRHLLVYGSGNGIDTPVTYHLVDLGDEPAVAPRPLGRDMEGMWASRSRTGELLLVQQGPDAATLRGVYTGFDAGGRPLWSAVRSRTLSHAHEYPLEVIVPVDGDARWTRAFAGITADGGSLMFLSCTEAVLEYADVPLPPQQFLSTRGARKRDGVRLSRLTAPNGCIDP
jgi:hypothetical protein